MARVPAATSLCKAAAAIALLGVLVAGALSPGAAQDGTPEPGAVEGRPVFLQAGGCDDPGEEVALLSDLTPFEGEEVGQEGAVVAESSYTNVALLPEDIQAEDHVINAVASADDDESVVCGEIGGPLSPNGTLIVGLREQNGSGLTGVAYLSPGGDGASTDVSVFVAPNLSGGGGGESGEDDEAEASPVAAVEAAPEPFQADETVEVSLVEWSVDLPAETAVEAGQIAFEVRNDGTIRHSLEIEGQGLEEALPADLQPGETGTLEVELEQGTYVAYCPVGNHRNEGMETELVVS